MNVVVASLSLSTLLGADEVFITSTVREVVPVTKIIVAATEHRIGAGTPGPRTRDLHRGFRSFVGADSIAMPWE
jgi:branched-chain amino acid aminotransferase